MFRPAHLPRLLPALAAVFLLGACAHYRLGTGSALKFQTLFVAPVVNTAAIPQAQVLVTTQIREALLHDGRVTLVDSPGAADAVLQVTLTSYSRVVAVTRPDDTGLARRFDVSLHAEATLTDNRTRQPYFTRRPLVAQRGVFTDNGLVPSEYQALPLLAELLADETTHAVLDTW
jgi:hypothetical protein